MANINVLVLVLIVLDGIKNIITTRSHRPPIHEVKFCKNNSKIAAYFEHYLQEDYTVEVNQELPVFTEIKLKLDIIANVKIWHVKSKHSEDPDIVNNIFTFLLLEDVSFVRFTISGRKSPHHPAYVLSLKINGIEQCDDPDRTYFQKVLESVTKLYDKAPDKFCGRPRKNRPYTELIVNGSPTNAGEWPWHAALMRLEKYTLKYICGGTLISKYIVLTAAHCATMRGAPVNPESIKVLLGKHSLVGTDIALQEKDVLSVIVHDDFNHKTLNSDIAMLKLTTEAIFNNYVQPACLWLDDIYDHFGTHDINGTVVGWGFDITDSLSTTLKAATMPKKADIDCIKFDPLFYTNILNGKKFCAGYGNGTSACNGDSGGGFMVFVRDDFRDPNAGIFGYRRIDYLDGAWYVRGVVSVTLARSDAAICDPNAYTVFTDVAVYRDWILSYLN